MTQTEFDAAVLGIADWETDMAYKASLLRRQNDPNVVQLEENIMMLQNVLSALRDYDITETYLSEEDIADYFELATQIVQVCPM